MRTYPGLAVPSLQVAVSRDESAARLDTGVSFEIESLTLVGNTGTYLDSPYHFHAERADLAGLPLERLVNVPIVMVRAFGRTAVTAADLGEPDRLWGRAVLVHTGWARDRKSTRLNSSHVKISYAVFCLKKKKKQERRCWRGQRKGRRGARIFGRYG